ncbi:MAG: hypothetical protein GWP45_08640 [Proteobacteria bacterium]|jgi:hypothetical protein|nr:hypothetical protein [Pseudomonadota bacterium]
MIMSLPLSSNSVVPPAEHMARVGLGAPKTVRGRGTYEGLSGSKTAVQQVNHDQTGKRLRETLAARSQDLSATAKLARANALITQAGLPSGLNKVVDRPTADVLAVRVQRQSFMTFALG